MTNEVNDHTYAELSLPEPEVPSTSRLGGWVCSGQQDNIEEYPQLKGWLPNQFGYHVCQYEEVASLGDHTDFDATVRVDVCTVEQAKEWVELLKGPSGVTWRVDVTRPRLGRRVLFKTSYKCQHMVNMNAGSSNRTSKNTCCPARMLVTLKSTGWEMSKTKDPHMPDFPFEVRIVNRHNHHLYVADAIRHRDVGGKAIEVLTGLFEIGHTATSALTVLKHDLQMEYGQQFVYASANREICPDLRYVQRYGKYLKYIERLYNRRECWALSYRGSLLTRGNNTNNFVEAAMRVLKDKILQRTKAFNLPQLFDLLTSRLETYYKTRIVDVALGRWQTYQRSRFLPQDGNIAALQIQQMEEKKFMVKGSTQTYAVDMELELCSCPAGQTGAPCKHQAAVAKIYSCFSNTFLPTTPEMRAELLKLTSGETISVGFLQPLRLTQPASQSFKEATFEPSTTSQKQEQLQEPGVLTGQQAQPSTSAAADTPQEDITHSGDISLVEDMMEDMKRRGQDPLFTAGLMAMAKQYHLLKTNPFKLLSAIHTFGKSGSLSSKRAATLRRAARRQGPMIGCQPTSVARRKSGGGSKRRLPAGRPVKRHSLSSSVALNISLAKKH